LLQLRNSVLGAGEERVGGEGPEGLVLVGGWRGEEGEGVDAAEGEDVGGCGGRGGGEGEKVGYGAGGEEGAFDGGGGREGGG